MPKQFYTERDIVDMFKGGISSLEINDNVVLTEMAYEKARSLGMRLMRDKPDNPPSAPVRPYISQKQAKCCDKPSALSAAASSAVRDCCSAQAPADAASLEQRIHNAVIARLGAQVDSNLLDVIIKRVLASTGVK